MHSVSKVAVQCQWNLFFPPPAPSFLIHLLCFLKHLHKKKHAQTKKGACVYVSVCVRVSVGTLAVLISTHRCIAKYVQSIAIYQVSKYTTVECSARQSSITLNFEFPCRDPPQTCISFKRFCGFHTQFCNWCWQNSAICACGVDLCWLESLWQAPPTAFCLADAIGISSAAFASVLVNVARLHYGEFDGIRWLNISFSWFFNSFSPSQWDITCCTLQPRRQAGSPALPPL